MVNEFAPGIPASKHKSTIRLTQPLVTTMAIQKHDAKRAGSHYDLRLQIDGRAVSWALKNLPTNPGDRVLAVRQPDHTVPYMTWEGELPSGYGAGTVKLFDQDKIEITKADLNHITFNRYKSNGDTERYTLIPTGGDDYLFINNTPTRITRPYIPATKPSYKSVPIDKLDPNRPNEAWSPKVDGALNAFLLSKGKNIEMYSYRPSVKDPNKLIDHTFRTNLYKVPTPNTLKGHTVLLGESFAVDVDGKVLPTTDTSARLLSNVWRSRELQNKAKLDNIVYNVLRYNGRDVSNKPYAEKLDILKRITAAVPELKMAPLAKTPEQKQKLLADVRSGRHPLSKEGIVVYDLLHHTPLKSKLQEDYDVHIRKIFPGEGKYTGKGAGGFHFSYTPDGPIVGKVGGGFDDKTRIDMYNNPNNYIGQVARVWAQEQLPSGALRMPIFKDLRPELWKKAAKTSIPAMYLIKNQGELIYNEKLPVIVKARNFVNKPGIPHILVSGNKAYGIISIEKAKTFPFEDIKIPGKYHPEQKTEWENLDYKVLYKHKFHFTPFRTPLPYHHKQGVRGFDNHPIIEFDKETKNQIKKELGYV